MEVVVQRKKRNDSIESLDDYCLDRLFDPEELYYTPMEELLKRYKKRSLRLEIVFSFFHHLIFDGLL